jgi:UDPglucose 6-dehydrogenase
MKIGIIGRGTVGDAVYNGLIGQGHQVSFYDPKFTESKLADVLDTECVFISVPTDSTAEGNCDTSIVERCIEDLHQANYQGFVGIKSTVVPGTTNCMIEKYPQMRIGCVPEFLRARMALADFVYNHDLLVIGVTTDADFELVKKVHGFIPRNICRVSPIEAELVKYFNNVHHAVQVTFGNIIYEICQKVGADYNEIYNAITKRDCINPHYLLVNENFRGFGGHCLPKDTKALNNLLKELNLDFGMLEAVLKDNDKVNNK